MGTVHLGKDLARAVRLVHQKRQGGREPDCQVEEAGLREPVLPALHPDQGDQLQFDLHLPRAARPAQGGSGHSVHQLWMPGLREQRLDASNREGQEC